ncbi:hypothetical protein GCM10025859_65770 [Alicyclobacillus fastidiosus]|nr:hypothetical protein GCM10025859_65770 [Alicyclobacillus fastidiosus]
MFSFAGFYDTWKGSDGQKISTCTIITCPPNARMRQIHDRMPVILRDHQDERFWLDPSVTDLDELLTVIGPYPEDDMYWYQVDKMVGNVNNDSEKCVEEIK